MVKPIRIRVKTIVLTLGLIVFIMFSILIYTMIEAGETSSTTALPEYNALFSQDAQLKLKVLATCKSNTRQTRTSYVYDDQYNLFVYKIILTKDQSLKNIITYKNDGLSVFKIGITSPIPSYKFKMDLRSTQASLVSMVNIISTGDTIKPVVKNDSLCCYNLKFKKFAINFNDDHYDITAYDAEPNTSMSVAFIKKKRSVYVVLMSKAKGMEDMKADLLYDIIAK